MVLARRMNGGSSWIVLARFWCWLASAVVVLDRFTTRFDRSVWRAAIVVNRLPVWVMKLVNEDVFRFSSENRTLAEATAGLRYCQAAWA